MYINKKKDSQEFIVGNNNGYFTCIRNFNESIFKI